MKLPAEVTIYEVGPRDGLQNEARQVPTADKIRFIDALVAAGIRNIEITSFVSPKWIPQLADAAEVARGVARPAGVRMSALVPNRRGLETALAAGMKEIAVFLSASETHNKKNVNKTIAETLAAFDDVVPHALAANVKVRAYVSTVFGCPYEGDVDPARVADVAARLHAMGAYEVSLGDTIGTGTAGRTQALFRRVAERVPIAALAGHFHDTYGQALANVYAALELGVAPFDCSVAGLGACPYAKGATGNVASEDVLYLLDGLGIETGVDMTRLRRAGHYISGHLQRETASRVARALDVRMPLDP